MVKFIRWFLFVATGTLFLLWIGERSVNSEREYFRQMILDNNKDIALLVTRHLVDEMKQIRSQIDGLGRTILKEDFNSDKIQSALRFQLENHPFIVGLRYKKNTAAIWTVFQNLGSGLSSSYLFKTSQPLDSVADSGFSLPFVLQDEYFTVLQAGIKNPRAEQAEGRIEAQISIGRLFAFSSELARKKRGTIILTDRNGQVLFPSREGWFFEKQEVSELQQNGYGGFQRQSKDLELVSYCSFVTLEPVHMPKWHVIFLEDNRTLEDFANRMQTNILSVILIGVLCLMVLGRVFFLR